MEDVKKIHRSILPSGEKPETTKLEEFPQRLSLTNQSNTEKTLSFITIIEKMLHVCGEPRKDNRLLASKMEETLRKFNKILLDPQNLQKIFTFKQKKKTRKLAIKRIFTHYLKALFPKEFKRFSEVKEASKLVFSSDFMTETQESDHELLDFVENLSETDQEARKSLDSNKEDFDFLNLRIDSMSQEEFLEFSYHRSLNFLSLGKEAFLDFIGFKNISEAFFKELKVVSFSFEIEFLNYILCRIVKEIIENSIKSMNSGFLRVMKTSISIEIFDEKAEFEVIGLKLKIKKLLAQKSSIEEKAFRLFMKEFWLFDYQETLEVFNTKIKLLKWNSHEIKINDEKKDENDIDPVIIWRNMKGLYQRYWFQRILAENQVKVMRKQGKSSDFVNEFAEFLYEKTKDLENLENLDFGFVFKDWFLKKLKGPNNFPIKEYKQKLESIFD